MADGNDIYSASEAKEMARLVLEEQADMVVGDRLSSTYFIESKSPFYNFGNGLVRFSINHIFKTKNNDIMTGYRAMSYQFVKTFSVNGQIPNTYCLLLYDFNINNCYFLLIKANKLYIS